MSSVKGQFIDRDIAKQPYRSSKSYQDQMRTATEKDAANIALKKESEFVRPYTAKNYEEMEYDYIPPPGFDVWDGDNPSWPDIPEVPDFPVPDSPPNQPFPTPQYPAPNPQFPGPGGDSGKNTNLPSPNVNYPELENYNPWQITFFCDLDPCWCAGDERCFNAKCTYPIIKILNLSSDGGITARATKTSVCITAPAGTDDGAEVSFDILMQAKTSDGKTVQGTYGTVTAEKCRPDNECCDPCASPFSASISYTTLQMSCDETQNLSVTVDQAGCGSPTYGWEITSGGGSLSASSGSSTTYTAPSSNADCLQNPTIQLKCTDTDVVLDSITIAVNCYVGGAALQNVDEYFSGKTPPFLGAGDCSGVGCPTAYDCLCGKVASYDCDGSFNSWVPSETSGAYTVDVGDDQEIRVDLTNGTRINTCAGGSGLQACMDAGYVSRWGQMPNDIRTQAMLDGGCCPEELL